jgi:hypothetical protein
MAEQEFSLLIENDTNIPSVAPFQNVDERPPPPHICYCITINKTLLFIIGMLLITSIVFFILIIMEPKTNPIYKMNT